ncbi:MAG: hypothetical protein K1060chlam1_00525 [Candidatus Anoxychlamydiales bacterium]|nr:hypothetical protein [Candidatus Anoxychlamydiales bacterium]
MPVIIPSKILLTSSIFGVTASAIFAFSQTIVEGMISVKKACSSRASEKESKSNSLPLDVSLSIKEGDQKAGMVHVMEKHVSKGEYLEFSKFTSDDKAEVIRLILEGWQMTSKKLLSDENGKQKWAIDMDRKIGYGKDKKPATKLIIVVRESDNYLITAYPRC